MTHEARAIINAGAESAGTPYGAQRAQVMSQAGFDTALAEISSWPGYAPTPLLALVALARQMGIGQLLYKDEHSRFGLGSFKALGGAQVVPRISKFRIDAQGLLQGLDGLGGLTGIVVGVAQAEPRRAATRLRLRPAKGVLE